MSYTAREQSAYDGHPLELYRFSYGDSGLWLFTSADDTVVKEEEKYEPAYVKRNGFTRTGDARKATLEIEVGDSNPVALLFRAGWLVSPLIVTIFRHHYEDNEFSVLWKGRVTGCRWAGSVATLTSDSVSTLFRRAGLRRVYQMNCPHALYGPACRLNQASWANGATADSASGNVVIIPAAAGFPDGYLTGGMLKSGDEYRMIVAHSGSSITMVDAISGLGEGSAVTLWPGCDRSMATCSGRFNNLANYGGLPFLPQKNPFSGDALV